MAEVTSKIGSGEKDERENGLDLDRVALMQNVTAEKMRESNDDGVVRLEVMLVIMFLVISELVGHVESIDIPEDSATFDSEKGVSVLIVLAGIEGLNLNVVVMASGRGPTKGFSEHLVTENEDSSEGVAFDVGVAETPKRL